MKFSIVNRIMLLNLLPNVGDIKSLKLQRILKEELSFSDDEQKLLQFNTNPQSGAVKWNQGAEGEVGEKEIEICATNKGVIQALLTDLDKSKKLQESHIDLWDMMFPEGGEHNAEDN